MGPMYSEKTTSLLSQLKRCALSGLPTLAVKWSADDRYASDDRVITHSGHHHVTTEPTPDLARQVVVSAGGLAEVESRVLAGEFGAVGVDEGQFFADLWRVVDWARRGTRVYVAALNGDYMRRPFPTVSGLIPFCSDVTFLRGVCMDCRKQDSIYSWRKESAAACGSTEPVIGGKGLYLALCGPCYGQRSTGAE